MSAAATALAKVLVMPKPSTEASTPFEKLSTEPERIERIRLGAYRFFEQRGSTHGADQNDWFQAETAEQKANPIFKGTIRISIGPEWNTKLNLLAHYEYRIVKSSRNCGHCGSGEAFEPDLRLYKLEEMNGWSWINKRELTEEHYALVRRMILDFRFNGGAPWCHGILCQKVYAETVLWPAQD